jgi:hypothetical protein
MHDAYYSTGTSGAHRGGAGVTEATMEVVLCQSGAPPRSVGTRWCGPGRRRGQELQRHRHD